MSDRYRRDIADILQALGTDREGGLPDAAATACLRDTGPNELPEGPVLTPWRILLSQFSSTMVAVLLEAGCPVAIVGQDWLPG